MSLPSASSALPPSAPRSSDSQPAATNLPSSQPSRSAQNASQGGLPAAASPSSAELSGQIDTLKSALRQYPDFPSPGILFEDIMPIFADPKLHETLISALENQVLHNCGEAQKPDVVVGLEARGFLFGPSLALRLGAGFVPVRKQGKLPGETETASYEKEYGADFFQIQKGGIKPGQRVIIVDDIIATGGSAVAAGSLVKKLGGVLVAYIFMMELDFLKGREKLDAPVYTLLSSQ